jgi:hypothetical protein
VVKNLWDINEPLPLNGGVSPARLIAIWETEEIFKHVPLLAIGPLGVLLGSGGGLGGGTGEGRRESWGRRAGWGDSV